MKLKLINAHMQVAEVYAQLSSARRLKVGAIIVKDNRIISIGYNGMPSGWTNDCEYLDITNNKLASKSEVLHAETNAIAKLACSHESGEGAYIFCTHSPCLECAKLIYQSGIKYFYYKNKYRNDHGIEFLKKAGVSVTKLFDID